MTSKSECIVCGTSTEDVINLGEMKTYRNITAHYYCLLLASTIKQSGEDEEGILGFLPSDIKDEVKLSQKRVCTYCKQKGAAVLCSFRNCKIMFHLPCGIKNKSGHQFYNRFLSHCRTHRLKQRYKKPSERQSCPICYENINFKNWMEILWAPCCKKQSFFHKKCIQQMALSAGYFFKCPMCNNNDVFQKTMKHYGVFIPDRDASWELEPNAFEDLLYRHRECNAKICLCKSGRTYDNLGQWNIVLCSTCGSQGTHINCSNLKKNKNWICELCVVEKKSDTEQTQINELYEPSTSHIQPQIPNNVNVSSTVQSKRKRNRNLRCSARSYSSFIEIDSEDSDVLIEDEPSRKCLVAQDRSLLKIHNNMKQSSNIEIKNQNCSPCNDFMNLIITDVRSLSDHKDNFIEKIAGSNSFNVDVAKDEFKNIVISTMSSQQQQKYLILQKMVYSNCQGSSNQHLGSTLSSSSEDIVIID